MRWVRNGSRELQAATKNLIIDHYLLKAKLGQAFEEGGNTVIQSVHLGRQALLNMKMMLGRNPTIWAEVAEWHRKMCT